MINDQKITISTGPSRRSVYWYPQEMLWSEFVTQLATPKVTPESFAVYKSMRKNQQDDLKDVGGFVGGRLRENRRKSDKVLDRCLITLDADNIPAGGTGAVLQAVSSLGCAYVIYSTRKHEEAAPRLRIVIPLDKTCAAEEYEPIARKISSYLDMAILDQTTFDVCRLMYWPSVSVDMGSQYVYTYADNPFLSGTGILSMYEDWHNVAEWPEIPGAIKVREQRAKRQGDPLEKKGVVGAFCRIYDVPAAMDRFLSGTYTPTDIPGRYTYADGSTVGGAILYDGGKFIYSHHATDPISGLLCNAFDLVRLHKFSDMDDGAKEGTPAAAMPSFTAMKELCVEDAQVKALIAQERYEKATEDFEGIQADGPANPTEWLSKLKMNSNGGYEKTIDNALIILENDPNLVERFWHDEFANRAVVSGRLPWETLEDGPYLSRAWNDADDAGLRHYMEKMYNITGQQKILDAMAIHAKKHGRHLIKAYLQKLVWDGIPRIETLLIDYFGAVDTLYTRAVLKKALVAAVSRIWCPGTKFDNMPILTGAQGIGKSTFFKKLGGSWFSDSLRTFEGKEASELLQGYWIIEVGELEGFNKSEMGTIKQFLSKQDDIYRAPYGRRTEAFPRRCVFFGTTNEDDFLRDRTGNRRFWPVDADKAKATKSVFTDLTPYVVDQIWAEASILYTQGEALYLTGRAEEEAQEAQEAHKNVDPRESMIKDFIARPVPLDWPQRDLQARRVYWAQGVKQEGLEERIPRDRICAAEVWCECFQNDLKLMGQRDARDINGILAGLKNCKKFKSTARFGGPYGTQRGFEVITVGPDL
ncbi:virulence-associated E family protein [Eubacterium barkeri]|uniref:Predicted P-loop ATPase and inactivated derivatives n=1 Tax=Eubacterium barkeri TaxID=1528 RepID=A0A1H3HED4_EUBBA|nr:virulence-associated E family protein [Eubacterium barkeri]SDY13832.1 Predicted P-loop ATPase and inactivated derivatives [Eubacterium barkeri]